MTNDENNNATSNVPSETGRFLFSLLIGLLVFGELINVFARNFSIFRIIIAALLLFLTYEGYRWARILLGVLAALSSIFGAVVFVFLMSKNESWALLLAVLSIIGASLIIAYILLLSKSAIAFLEARKQKSKHIENNPQEGSHSLSQYHELSEKIHAHLTFVLPSYEISTVLPIKNSEDKIVMMKYVTAFRNIFRCKPDGSIVWQAELPTTSGDVYTNIEWRDENLIAFSRSLIAVCLDVETGRIVDAKVGQKQETA